MTISELISAALEYPLAICVFPFCHSRLSRCSLGGEKSAANPFVELMQAVIDLVPLVFP